MSNVFGFKTRTQKNEIAHQERLLSILEEKYECAKKSVERIPDLESQINSLTMRQAIAKRNGLNVSVAEDIELVALCSEIEEIKLNHEYVYESYPELILLKKAKIAALKS